MSAHLRAEVGEVTEPRARAMFETSAEVHTGLAKAFDDFENQNEEAWSGPAPAGVPPFRDSEL